MKQDVLEALKELAELTILDEGDPNGFRVRAYESAARGIEAHPGDPAALDLGGLQKIDGIGKSTAQKIRELVETGRIAKLDELRAKHPASIVALLRIPGLGPKGINKLRAELGVTSIEDLRRAVSEHRLRDLKGFGAKTEEKLASALERIAQEGTEKRTPISVALPLAERIVERIRAVPGVSHASYAGSLRRFCETIGDVDVIVAATDPAAVFDTVVAMPFVDRVLGRGDTKTSVVTRRGMQIDVRVVAAAQLGAAMLYFTGSKAHNVKLRQRALDRGWTLNEYALADGKTGAVIASETEEAIYRALDLPFIDPVLREDQGELDLATAGALPPPIGTILGDFHVHTEVSGDGRSPLDAMIAAAKARGHRILAITEHAEGTVSGVRREALLDQRAKLQALQSQLGDELLLLHGVELNIGPAGELDYDPEFRALFDWCLASVHDHFDLPRAEQTARVIAAMRDPCVRMIGHLSARMIGGRPGIDLDLDAVFAAADETGTALEINGGLPRLDLSVEALRRARGRSFPLVLTSDAHHESELDRIDHAAKNARRAGVDPQRIANTWPLEKLTGWARGTKVRPA
jgi:DNA polymerase (family 10)